MSAKRYIRLLPSVLVVGTGLLFLKGSGLVHEAYAQDAPATQSDSAPAPDAPKDYAGDDTEVASAAEVDVLTSLSKRRGELDARESDLQMQANVLAATEQRVDGKIAQLKQLQDQITALVAERDDQQKAQIAALVKTYTGLGKKAGPIFAGLPDNVAVPVAEAMKPDDLAVIMGAMPADAAQKLTVKLANRLALPDTTALTAPLPAAPVAPVPGAAPAAAGTPATPAQQAAAAAPPPAAKPPGG